MPTYITLINYTRQGIENIKEGPARLDKAREAVKVAGEDEYREIIAALP